MGSQPRDPLGALERGGERLGYVVPRLQCLLSRGSRHRPNALARSSGNRVDQARSTCLQAVGWAVGRELLDLTRSDARQRWGLEALLRGRIGESKQRPREHRRAYFRGWPHVEAARDQPGLYRRRRLLGPQHAGSSRAVCRRTLRDVVLRARRPIHRRRPDLGGCRRERGRLHLGAPGGCADFIA